MEIPNDVMQQMVAKAIFETMTPEQREALVSGAITHLLTKPPKDQRIGGPAPRSPLQEAFEMAVYKLAREMSIDMIANDEGVRTKVKGLFTDVMDKVFDNEDVREKIATKMAEGMSDIFRSVR
jgi:hypothetical protein